jgi:hypothetical protein
LLEQKNLNRHLRILLDAGLVTEERHGRAPPNKSLHVTGPALRPFVTRRPGTGPITCNAVVNGTPVRRAPGSRTPSGF